MGSSSPPPAPDPYKVASAEGKSNVQTGIANSVLANPNVSSAARQRVEQAMYGRAQPQLDRSRAAEENRLVNQGFARGSQAYNDAMGDIGRQENDLRLGITAAGLGEQQGMYGMARDAAGFEMNRRAGQQNQPINALTALMSGSQVQAPNTPGYNAPTIQGTNVGQNVYASSAIDQQNYAQKMAQQNAMIGGAAGLVGTLGSAAMGVPPGMFGGGMKLWGGR